MKYIIFEQQDKKLGMLFPADIDSTLEEIAKKSLPPDTNYAIVDDLNLDDYFFDAYEYINGEAIVNYEKAKEIQKSKWREARNILLEKLDVEYMKALERNDVALQKQISTKKQELRDITNTILINNLEAIKNTWPNILNSQ